MASSALFQPSAARCFSYDHGEIKKLELQVRRKMQILRMFSDLKDFDYEAPQMQYDKKTGDIKIIEGGKQGGKQPAGPAKKVIGSMDDLEREKKALFEELGLDPEGYPKNTKEPVDKIADRLKTAQDRMTREFEMDPSAFHVFSRDLMRVDVGLLI